DLTGMRQLVYHHSPGKVLVFATEPEAVLQHSDVARRLNEGRIGDFLEGLEAYDLSSTFYQGIAKLPPGHSLTLRDRQLRIKRSMQLAAPARLKLPSDEAYAEAFRDVFTEAVRSRLRSPAPVASMLSGGMDSGSVSAIAARLLKQSQAPPLHTFSAIGTDPECPETRAIEAALEIDHISPTRISLGEIASYRADLERLVNASAEPFDASMTLLYAVYLFAQRSGHKVMLDGVGGDTTLGSPNMIAWHLRGGRVMQAWREAKGEEQFWDHPEPALPGFIRGVRQAYIPQWLRDLRGAFRQNGERTSASLVSPDFDERIGMTERRLENAEHIALSWGDSLENRMKRVLHPYIIVARERYDRVASALAIEPRDPFLDRRVLEFCLSLPADQLQKNGWPKTVLRRSMDGLLPDAVRWRAGKEHLGWDFTQSLWRDSEDLAEVIDSPLVQDYIRAAEWGTKILHGEHDSSFEDRLTIHYLSAWISMRGRVEQATEHS
ncbi:MAG: asparagine synthetase B family protein, partial [Pseudomonadota bacterium]